ncbi:hypothetical protein E3N88_18376 [Mikania micrantha]|uniref:Uncharacterized protein n=1 Tax=Mikania micrantha TaxID=192012 RepID=A0A5N6NLW9_9ASTR|nr:hypothetical protein E3N88_18376 [Mikania micrantha]
MPRSSTSTLLPHLRIALVFSIYFRFLHRHRPQNIIDHDVTGDRDVIGVGDVIDEGERPTVEMEKEIWRREGESWRRRPATRYALEKERWEA